MLPEVRDQWDHISSRSARRVCTCRLFVCEGVEQQTVDSSQREDWKSSVNRRCVERQTDRAPSVGRPLITPVEQRSHSLEHRSSQPSTTHSLLLLRTTVVGDMWPQLACRMGLLACRNAGMAAVSGRSARLLSSGHEVDIFDKKLYPPGQHPPSYDEHIVPSGCWHENHAALQKKYNIQLLLASLLLGSTIYYMTICPEIDLVMPPKSIGVNPPAFSAVPKD